jgi:hypothetical protein
LSKMCRIKGKNGWRIWLIRGRRGRGLLGRSREVWRGRVSFNRWLVRLGWKEVVTGKHTSDITWFY